MNQLKKKWTEVKFPVPWGHIAAKVYDSTSERKILMIHGLLDNAGTFDRLIELLPSEYQYVSIDLPGHGLSSSFPPGVPLHFFDYVYSILLVLDALKWKTCMCIAHSLGAHIGMCFGLIYPERLEKIVTLDGILPFPADDLISHIREIYDLKSYAKGSDTLYTKDEIMYALKFRRSEALNTEAAEALFKRAVTKINDLYKFNRDVRLRYMLKPNMKVEQQIEIFEKFSIPILIILADDASKADFLLKMLKDVLSVVDKNKVSVAKVKGNHDVHNNYPDRVVPHICRFLCNDLKSKL